MNGTDASSRAELCWHEKLPALANAVRPAAADRRFRPSSFSLSHRAGRALWGAVWLLLFRPSPKVFHGWRRFLLRLFGARIGASARPYPGVRIWAPWNLQMGEHSCLASGVDCYTADVIRIGSKVTVSQYSFLCTASHDIDSPDMTLITAPILIEDHAWIAADAFVGPGVTIGEGAVIGARASVCKDVPPWTVVAGNPARPIRLRARSVAERHIGKAQK